MFFNGRKTIGVFISQLNYEYQQHLCNGISTRAKELDYNVAYFTNFGGYSSEVIDKGESRIADLPCYENLDGIIIATDILVIKGLKESILNHIKTRSNCPVVSVRRPIDEYYNVLIDDTKVLEEIIRHFIEVHGFTRLNFLAGPEEHPDSIRRLECYKRVLEEYNIPIENERIYFGDFWKVKGKMAARYWLNSHLPMPQAIICANDYMAITLTEELERRGISVPEDIAVSGCDDIAEATEYKTALTTVKAPFREMGKESVDKIDRILQGLKEEKNSYLPTKTIFRESCGCEYKKDPKPKSNRPYFRIVEDLQTELVRNAYMSANLTGITTQEEMNSRLRHYVYENKGFTDFYMCLFKNWQSLSKDEDNSQYLDNDEMIMEVGIKDFTDYGKISFSKKNLIPPQFIDDKPLIYFFTMLHNQGVSFGYVAIAFNEIKTYMLSFQTWMINVSNVLENIRVHNELSRLVYKLEDMYIRDELTGLYNRRGLQILGEKYLKQSIEKKTKLMILTADLDKLKMINDNYGHAGGDIALKAVAKALEFAADDDEICVRFGGDEFIVVGLEYDEKKARRFIRRFIGELNSFNQNSDHEFSVYVSYGWSLVAPNHNSTIEESLNLADTKMYKQKQEKAALMLRANIIQ